MEDWIINVINQYGYLSIILLIAVENIFPPIPSEVILTFGGFLTTYTYMNPWWVIVSATVGSLVGAVVLYLVGRLLAPERLEKLLDGKVGKILRFKKEDLRGAVKWFSARGERSVLLCRCVPIVRSLISIPAGMMKMKPVKFLILTTIGSTVWNILLVFLGVAAGGSWMVVVKYLGVYSWIVAAAISVGIFVLMISLCRRKFKKMG